MALPTCKASRPYPFRFASSCASLNGSTVCLECPRIISLSCRWAGSTIHVMIFLGHMGSRSPFGFLHRPRGRVAIGGNRLCRGDVLVAGYCPLRQRRWRDVLLLTIEEIQVERLLDEPRLPNDRGRQSEGFEAKAPLRARQRRGRFRRCR